MRFYNTGKFTHQIGRNKDTGDMVEHVKDLAPDGHEKGTCIVNFPGHQLRIAVKAGEFVDLPHDLSVETVKRACPSLLTEDEAKPLLSQSAPKPAKG